LKVRALGEELGDRLGRVPEPGREQDKVADHDARPVLLLGRALAATLLGSLAGGLALRLRGESEVADNKLEKRDVLIVVVAARERDVARKLLRVLRAAQQVGHEEAREERAVGVERLLAGVEVEEARHDDRSSRLRGVGEV
jgi:hypothetical protein